LAVTNDKSDLVQVRMGVKLAGWLAATKVRTAIQLTPPSPDNRKKIAFHFFFLHLENIFK
jgi:hypothetical protein